MKYWIENSINNLRVLNEKEMKDGFVQLAMEYDLLEQSAAELYIRIQDVLKWRGPDGDGISDPLREILIKTLDETGYFVRVSIPSKGE